MTQTISTLSIITAAAILISCGGAAIVATADNHGHHHNNNSHEPMPPFVGVNELVAVVHGTSEGDASGTVRFKQDHRGRVTVTARIEGLEPNQKHGFHVHEFGDCSADDATSAGGHYNPEGHPHGIPNDEEAHLHAGDFGNLEADDDGVAEFELIVENISLAGTHNPIVGRAVIVHRDEDDGSQPLGDAGPRIGCGVIGVAQLDGE
ncbi:superoxide dismutase family protein [Phycisphaerales bacterium AB-hyl4]|uniref:Superoxide dismutase [Cu-Zn] n=1 Tax=Natronomicrosphaera hydrolytica TaxID=3242702 RepID=A0ABV4U7A8_9BACT